MRETLFERPPQIIELEFTVQERGAFLALSRSQREAIRDQRDEGICRFPGDHLCNGEEERLEVHHIQGQAWGRVHGIPQDCIDNPNNTIAICKNAHDMIHPERKTARDRYQVDKGAFKSMRPTHFHDGKYWDDRWDGAMFRIARERTEQARINGWEFPD